MAEKKIKAMFVVEPSLKARAEKAAKEQGISFSELIRNLLRDCVGGDPTVEDQIRELKKEFEDIKKSFRNLEIMRRRYENSDGC